MAMFISDRPMQKVLLKNTTRMSLHERFTYLRSNVGDGSNATQTQRELQQMTARNRRLALQMERRPAVMAALKLKKRSLRQRLGFAGSSGAAGFGGGSLNRVGVSSIKDRLSLGGRKGRTSLRGGARLGQQQQSPLQRRGRSRVGGPNARGRLSRSQSMQSLNSVGKFGNRARSRSRSRSRVRANSISNLSNNNGQMRFRNKQQNRGGSIRGGGKFIQRGRIGSRGIRGNTFRGRQTGNSWGGRGRRGGSDFRGRGGIRGRGGRRGIGRGGRGGRGGRRGGGNNPVPTKEELDSQLDQYMASTRYGLDKDIDTYMKEANASGTTSTDGTGMTQGESWD